VLLVLLFIGWLASPLWGQDRFAQWGMQGLPSTSSVVPHFEMEYLSPQVHRWYAPRNLLESHMRPWYITDTNYARDYYTRYVGQLLEGEVWYDEFGHRLGHGWLVYTWEQEQEKRNGSQIQKGTPSQARTNAYYAFFQSLVIASDGRGGSTARLMVGDAIQTSFTPLTFSKGRFNGLRLDYATDRYLTSLILSRPSRPESAKRTNVTHLIGNHTQFQLGDLVRTGFTYVNAHNAQSQVNVTYGNPLRGTLTTSQNQSLKKLWVRIRDDSPEDGVRGAMVFRYDIVLTDTSGTEIRGHEIGFLPTIEGGRIRSGGLVADGAETILLEYDLESFEHEGIRSSDLHQVRVELVVADDYQVEMASDLQTDGERRNPETVFLPYGRAEGNVQDNSNSQVLRLDYGLPTANEVIGVNWDLVEWKGFTLQGEGVLNRQYRMYPSGKVKHLHQAVHEAHAAYVNTAYNRYPWSLFGEFFSIGDGYSTAYWLTQGSGEIRYKAPIPEVYEFVDDDDDFDGSPEWERLYQGGELVAWPGYDETGDSAYDSNQNRNMYPDYEEPFLRFRSDRPEFLFGLDMNHNGTIDRFENDNLPDYPYKKDHRGFNVYLRAHAGPDALLTLGHQRLGLISGDGRTHAYYLLGAWTWHPPRSRLRLFDFAALVKDDIADDLELWHQPVGGIGRMREVVDPLPARDTWKNSLYVDLEQRPGKGVRLLHRGKWELLGQRYGREELRQRERRRWSGFVGIIDKAEWSIPIGLGMFEPRWKSEFRWDRPFRSRSPEAMSLEQTIFLLWAQPLLAEQTTVNYFARYGRQLFATELQVGLEGSRFWMLEGEREEIDQDYTGWALVTQLTNRVGYMGYRLVTRLGAQWQWRDFERDENQHYSMLFVTMHAGRQ
jgi:hypothetical protein